VNKKDNRVLCLETIGLIVAPWKCDVLKTSLFALEVSLLGQKFVLRTSHFHMATISQQFRHINTLLFKYSNTCTCHRVVISANIMLNVEPFLFPKTQNKEEEYYNKIKAKTIGYCLQYP